MAAKTRLDQAVYQRGLTDSREQARRMVLAGEVRVDGHMVDKPATKVPDECEITVKERPRFVSRGGLKLEGAIDAFGIDVSGMVGLDIGSSTGGFTDCLLQKGAAKVHGFDVGTNQLVWKLRQDPRVILREQFNARNLRPEDVGELVDIVVIDVSFISLLLVLAPAIPILRSGGHAICLIKPQFELDRDRVGKGGIVREPEFHEEAVEKIRRFVEEAEGIEWQGLIDSPIKGTDGNKEFLTWLRKT
ncbi:MAG: TlyA family RNA methyltransferase [Verrucomicrobiae bacterium]|nr:TlyA family RNA methyltransferase [Verrucomicrobiae bacterium]